MGGRTVFVSSSPRDRCADGTSPSSSTPNFVVSYGCRCESAPRCNPAPGPDAGRPREWPGEQTKGSSGAVALKPPSGPSVWPPGDPTRDQRRGGPGKWKARREGVSQARGSLADLLLFWLPIGLGAISCGAGVVTLARGGGRDPEASRRALIGLILSVVPGCLCTLWVLAFAVSPILER